jgi:hypothetical protein
MEIKDTSIYQGYSTLLKSDNLMMSEIQFDLNLKAFFEGVAEYLGSAKKTDTPVALVVSDFQGNMIVAGYCLYDRPEEAADNDEATGNWLVDFTFNKEDIPANAEKVEIKEPACYFAFKKSANNNGFYYKFESDIIVLNVAVAKAIVDWLDANAVEGEVVEIKADGIFSAKVEVINGEKVLGIKIAEEVKDIAKGDRILSETVVK